jgi:hypothetical protein
VATENDAADELVHERVEEGMADDLFVGDKQREPLEDA